MRKLINSVLIILLISTIMGCGKKEYVTEFEENQGATEPAPATEDLEEKSSEWTSQETDDNEDEDTMYVFGEVDELKSYDSVEDLLGGASALVKVEVLQADSANVRSYVYTSYNVQILDTLYGEAGESGTVIIVNMPGGVIQGGDAQKMIAEVTEGKDAGDLSNIEHIVSNGNTDRLLTVGDEAYLFLVPESDSSYAVVGEYRGEILLDNGMVFFDNNIARFENKTRTNEIATDNTGMSEEQFLTHIEELIAGNK